MLEEGLGPSRESTAMRRAQELVWNSALDPAKVSRVEVSARRGERGRVCRLILPSLQNGTQCLYGQFEGLLNEPL